MKRRLWTRQHWFFRLVEGVIFMALLFLLHPLAWWQVVGLVVGIIFLQSVSTVEERYHVTEQHEEGGV